MAGQIKRLIVSIIEKRAKGNPTIAMTTETKLIMKGIDPSQYKETSPDDPVMVAKVRAVAVELGVVL